MLNCSASAILDASTVLALAAIVLVGMALALSQFCMVRPVVGVRAGDYSPSSLRLDHQFGHRQRPEEVVFVGVALVGLLVRVGLLHQSDWPWAPSRLASHLGRALHGAPVPASAACALLLPLGMLIVQRWRGLVQPTRLKTADLQLLLW